MEKNKFSKDILEFCDSFDMLIERESFWISMFKPKNKRCDWCYNMVDSGEGKIGWCPTEETKVKMRLSSSGEKNGMYGKRQSEYTKKKISKLAKGRKHRPESIKLMSRIKKGERNNFFGRTHSEETRKKISDSKSNSVLQISMDGSIIKRWRSPIEINNHFNTTAAYFWIRKKIFKNNIWTYEKNYQNGKR